nr:hypothetical protein [Tanacetum cinerariifolium]
MSYDDICPIFVAKFNTNVAFIQKTKEQIEEEESRALKRLNETSEEKASKRQKLDEEVEELKRHRQIVPNEDDDVYTKATPLARKVPVVDYEIIEQNNKPYYKIIRADARYTCSSLEELKKCTWSRKGQGLEAIGIMWCTYPYIYNHTADFVIREKVPTHKIQSGSDTECLTLRAMFKKPDIHAQVWKNQRSVHGLAKVKGWKLLESCGVHIITFTTIQLILLLERKYPLTRFNLDQILNAVRLEIEEESKAKEDPVVKRYQVLKRKPQTKAQARKNMMTKEQIKKEESRALKRLNETSEEKASKRQKLDEEVEELKRHRQIVPNEDDDVYIKATPLARKVPVVDYEIIEQKNKPYYKIIRADGSDVVTTAKLITKVVTSASETITAASETITTFEAQVPVVILTAAPARVTAAPSRTRKGVVIRDPQEESTTSTINPAETKSKDKGKGILVEEPKPLKKQAQIEQDEKYARELEAELNKTIDWDKAIDHVKKKAKE